MAMFATTSAALSLLPLKQMWVFERKHSSSVLDGSRLLVPHSLVGGNDSLSSQVN